MDETQFGGPDAQEPTGRKPDGRCLLNRLSPDRQAAVADYAATHALPETVAWLKNPGWPPEPGGVKAAPSSIFHLPSAITPRPPAPLAPPPNPFPPMTHQSINPSIHLHKPPVKWACERKSAEKRGNVRKKNKKTEMTPLAQPAHPSTAQGRIPPCRLKAAFRSQPERRLQAAARALEEIYPARFPGRFCP